MNENNSVIPARLRLMAQEEFVRKFHKHVISAFNVYESSVARNDYQTAENMQQVLKTEMYAAISTINGDKNIWNMSTEFVKVGGQERQLLNETSRPPRRE